ncbi:hypothetical protein ACN09C_27680 (plasmid) [Serratia fonticola]|uniref:hypothetical protein n=1 Tax=Serratia fonticola TaxID=47917 RepID=UPI003B00079F
MTFIMVFGELARLNAEPSSFALAFILSTSPGFLGSIAGKSLLARIEAKYCFMIAECIGALGLIIPWYGLSQGSVAILQLAGIASSVSAGITIPAINHYTKAKLAPEDIGAGAVIDTLVFACQVLFGIGIGAFLYGTVQSNTYLLANLLSYIIAIIFIFSLPTLANYVEQNVYAQGLPKSLSAKQRASLYLLPALAITGAPAMSLLPTLVNNESEHDKTLLFLLFARSLGQLLGPFLVKEERYKNQSPLFIIACMTAFVVFYLFVPLTPFLSISLILVFCAHVFSNIIYSLGWYSLLTNFDTAQVAAASANSYRKQIIVGALVSMMAGILADRVGSTLALVICSITGLVLSTLLILYVKRQS